MANQTLTNLKTFKLIHRNDFWLRPIIFTYILIVLPSNSSANHTKLEDLGDLSNGTTGSYANGVSANGLVVVGYSFNGTANHAFRYFNGKMVDIGALGTTPLSNNSFSNAVSGDGSVIVGNSNVNGKVTRAFKYAEGAMLNLGALGGGSDSHFSIARGVSHDGSVIVGNSYNGTKGHAFKHVDGKMVDLGALGVNPALNVSVAYSVSANGSVIVGESYNGTATHAFKHFDNKMVDLGALGINHLTNTSSARAVSANGLVIVGFSFNGSANHAFKHVDNKIIDLGALGDNPSTNSSSAYGVSADGSVIVGESFNGTVTRAFKYFNGEMTDLGALGANPSTHSSSARAVSADGSVIVGHSFNGTTNHAFIYTDNVMLDVDEWRASINGLSGLLLTVNSLSSLPLEGAHHRPLISFDTRTKKRDFWITRDVGVNSLSSDNKVMTGEAGFSDSFGGIVVGIAAGYGTQKNDLIYGGFSKVTGQYLLGEIDYQIEESNTVVSITAMVGTWQANTLRGYAIGAGETDYSHGRTDLNSMRVRLRLDGPAIMPVSLPTLLPFASYTWGHNSAKAYSETGGSFDAQFNKQTHNSQEARLGLTLKNTISLETSILTSLEWIHRFDRGQPILSGSDIIHSAMPFSVAGVLNTRNQIRFGIDFDRQISDDTLFNLSLHFTGVGESPDISSAISIRRTF